MRVPTFGSLALVVLALALALPPRATAGDEPEPPANTGTTRLDFAPREWLKVGLDVNGVSVDRVKVHEPGKVTAIMVEHDEANRGKIVVTNATDKRVVPSIAMAVFDEEGRLLAAANTGVRLKGLDPGQTKELEIRFGGVFRHIGKGKVLYVSLEY